MIPYLPIGSIVAYAGDVAPNGWLLCTGDVYYSTDELTGEDTEYKALYDIIGTTFGIGDLEGSFKVPDLRNRFIEGSTTIGYKSMGLPLPTITLSSNSNHNHTFTGTQGTTSSNGSHSHSWSQKTTNKSGKDTMTVFSSSENRGSATMTTNTTGAHTHTITPSGTVSSNGSHTHTMTVSTSGCYGNSTSVQPKSVCLNYIIKYQ